jgi:cyclopropane fatty-acyl-phospholipid synthase-like methyltransferase
MIIMDVKDINWNDVWREQYEASVRSRGSGDCATIWKNKEKALQFYRITEENQERIPMMVSFFSLSPALRILDIGAGPGTLAIPLSGVTGHVTAVEPAAGMIEVMKERIREKSIHNIDIVHKRWEDVDIHSDLHPPYDLVIASHSLGMPDIRTAIEMMQKVCSGEIWLFWFAGITSWEVQMKDLWPVIHGRPFVHSPKSDILFQVLYQMEIYPDIRMRELEQVRKYSSMIEAVEDSRSQLNCSKEHDEVIREYLSLKLKEQDGMYVQKGMTRQMSFTWKPR